MPERPPLTLTTPIQYAKGVGEVRAGQFVGLGIRTCGDLLFYMPRDYLQFADEGAIAAMRVGEVATVKGKILQTRMHRRLGRTPARLEAMLEDATPPASAAETPARCILMWFNPYDLASKIPPGTLVRVTGKVTAFRNRLQIVQAKLEVLDGKDEDARARKMAHIEPVYAATADLTSAAIWRILKGMLDELAGQVDEWFPPAHLAERKLMPRQEALRVIHAPGTMADATRAKRSLAYHEFFLHQAAFAIKRYHQRHGSPAVPLRVDETVDRRIRALLPFGMTAAQNRVIEAIRKDLAATKPMNRLLQGDVGSGKTVVALYAMLAACATARGKRNHEDTKYTKTHEGENENRLKIEKGFNGHQAALMAPTEILAEQHIITLSRLLAGKKVKIALLTGSVTGPERREVLRQIAEGTVGIVVGTHALLTEAVRFKSLAAIVIDEQHKFGVEQRSRIRTKPSDSGITPHMLVMTATPIPRTLAMTAFGDLDISVIDELPPGRQPIFTRMTQSSTRDDVYEWLAKKLGQKEQAYLVVPAIDDAAQKEEGLELVENQMRGEGETGRQGATESPQISPSPSLPVSSSNASRVVETKIETRNSKLETLRTAVGVQRELQAGPLKEFRVGMIHGRMARETRQQIMERFRQHLIDVLVATTVIEVGVDVPNASIMIVENADRFGLSQLHQLRGRVGRGTKQSTCVLVADLTTDDAVARLQAMVKHASGFLVAEEDLKIRGMGQLIGTAQSGRTDIHFAELLFDSTLLPLSRRDAFNIIAADPRLLDPSHTKLRQAVLNRFADTITLADVG